MDRVRGDGYGLVCATHSLRGTQVIQGGSVFCFYPVSNNLFINILFFLLRTNRPVRCVLDRGDDMLITGGRHPVLGKYKVRIFF